MLYAITQSSFLCFALIHDAILWVKGFQGKMSILCGPERLCQSAPRNAKCARLAGCDKIRNVVSLTFVHMIAQQLKAVEYSLPSSVFHENWQ